MSGGFMRYRTKQEVIEFVQGSERVGEAIAAMVSALDSNSNTQSEKINLFKVIDEETDFARNEILEVAS
jgi:hypothetical protein